MSNLHNHSKKYSLTDIEQYLQGKLSPAEMHEMEKAAVQDPFWQMRWKDINLPIW